VLDFGVAGRVQTEGVPTLLMGTPNYMSPEQIIGQPIDQRSDIFSVGLVLYELVSCRQAFTADTQEGVLLKVLNESPEPLTSLVADIDPVIPAIVNRALEKHADARYPDLDAMRSDLSRVAQRIEIGEAARIASHRKAQRSGARQRPPEPADDAARVHDLLATAERDAYEGRYIAAIRKLEASGLKHTDVLAAIERYRADAAEAARASSEAEAAEARALTDLVRGQVGGVRAAIAAGRWSEAAGLIAALEARLPVREGDTPAPAAEASAADPAAFVLTREEEVAHYLTRARQRLDSGDISSALALVDAALGVTLVARPLAPREGGAPRGEGARDR
jgi:hypothetical protein